MADAAATPQDTEKKESEQARPLAPGEKPAPGFAFMTMKTLKECIDVDETTDLKLTPVGLRDGPSQEPAEEVFLVELDSRYASFEIVRKEDELEDANFPGNMTAVLELFGAAGLPEAFKKCRKAVDSFLSVLEAGPDGKSSHTIGPGCICFKCGHAGVAQNAEVIAKSAKVAPICRDCGEKEHCNRVICHSHEGSTVPWIQVYNEAQSAAATKAAAAESKIGRNDPCTCGSKKKFKKCCGA